MLPRKLVIVGTGGTSVDIFDALLAQRAAGNCDFEPFCFLDDNPSRIGQALHGLPMKGPLEVGPRDGRLRVHQWHRQPRQFLEA